MTADARVLVTGSRDYADVESVRLALAAAQLVLRVDRPTLVHGAAKGLDALAAQAAAAFGWVVEPHPADWDAYGRSAGPRRNEEMAALGAGLVLAFPLHHRGSAEGSRGTWHCAAAARRAGLSVLVVWDGSLWPDDDDLLARSLLEDRAARVGAGLELRWQLPLADAALPF